MAIPAWQFVRPQNKSEASSPNKSTSAVSDSATVKAPSNPLLSQARRFLREEKISDAPRSEKEKFLQSKGVSREEIRMLLEQTRDDTKLQNGAAPTSGNLDDSQIPISRESDALADPSRLEPRQLAEQPQQNDIPPIITYPEFLSQRRDHSRPPVLVTTQRLLNLLYVSLTVYTSVYAGAQYIINPMRERLNEARGDLQKHAKSRVDEFNKKLEKTVSTIPPVSKDGRAAIDAEVSEDDPALCFQHNAATQTSPSLEIPPAPASLNDEDHLSFPVVSAQTSKLHSLQSNLSSLVPPSPRGEAIWSTQGKSARNSSISENLKELQHSIDLLYYESGDPKKSQDDKNGDIHRKLRGEIKAMKGKMLSARNFPSGARRVSGVS